MSYNVLKRQWSFNLPSLGLNGVATFENKKLVIQANGMSTQPQGMKDINDLYEAENTFKKCFKKDALAKGYFVMGANCIFDGEVDGIPYRCTLQAVIPAGQAVPMEKITGCLVSAVDSGGRCICSNVPVQVPYHHYNASLNKAEAMIRKYLGK